MIVRVIDWSKASLTRYHNSLPWPTFRHLQSEGTRWSDNKSLPMIISHDHLHRSLTAASPTTIYVKTARRVMMALSPPSVIMTTQNISPPLKKNQSFWYYRYQPSHKEEGKLAIPSKRPTDLSLSLTMVDKTIGGCVRTPRPDVFCRWNDWIKNLYWLRSCAHPFGNYVDHQGRAASTVAKT